MQSNIPECFFDIRIEESHVKCQRVEFNENLYIFGIEMLENTPASTLVGSTSAKFIEHENVYAWRHILSRRS